MIKIRHPKRTITMIARFLMLIGLVSSITGCESRWLNLIESSSRAYYACKREALYPNSCERHLSANTEATLEARKRGIEERKIQAADSLGRIAGNPDHQPSPYSIIAARLGQSPLNLSYSTDNSAPFDKNICQSINAGQFFKIESTIKYFNKNYYAIRAVKGCQILNPTSGEAFQEVIATREQIAKLNKSGAASGENTIPAQTIVIVEGNEDADIKLKHHIESIAAAERAQNEAIQAKIAEIKRKLAYDLNRIGTPPTSR